MECSYCDCEICGVFVIYGGCFLHKACYDQLQVDLDESHEAVEEVAVCDQ